MTLQTEFDFTLPLGCMTADGKLLREGRMRRALAIDEIQAADDLRVQANPAYLTVLLLSRVITGLGELSSVPPETVERFFAADLAYLEDMYLRINSSEEVVLGAVCPHCNGKFQIKVAPLGVEED
jgi:hypothetical protein